MKKTIIWLFLSIVFFSPLYAQRLLEVDTTYQGVLDAVFANPDIKIQFEQTNNKIVVSYYSWYASYYFTNGKLYQIELSSTFTDSKVAEVEYKKYTEYAQNTLEARIGKEISGRRKHQVAYVNTKNTMIVRMETIRTKTIFVVCLTRCHIAPENLIEPDDCLSMP